MGVQEVGLFGHEKSLGSWTFVPKSPGSWTILLEKKSRILDYGKLGSGASAPGMKLKLIKNSPLLENSFFSYYLYSMSITQTVEIPANRRLTIDVPPEVPTGPVILTFTPAGTEPKKERVFGCARGQFKMADDFDDPLEDFKDYM